VTSLVKLGRAAYVTQKLNFNSRFVHPKDGETYLEVKAEVEDLDATFEQLGGWMADVKTIEGDFPLITKEEAVNESFYGSTRAMVIIEKRDGTLENIDGESHQSIEVVEGIRMRKIVFYFDIRWLFKKVDGKEVVRDVPSTERPHSLKFYIPIQ
jgi:hypothetical protein